MAQRIKGQEVVVVMVVAGQPQVELTAIKSFEMKYELEIKKEGYLGETSDRRDSLFNGITGSMEVHLETKAIFTTIAAIVDKARRRTPGTIINIKATLNFPNGDRVRVIIPNCEFGEIPINFGSRTDYGTTTFSFEAQDAQTISS